MKLVLCGMALSGLATVLAHTASALACGATNPPFYAVERHAPTGDAAPLNTPVIVGLRELADGPVVDSLLAPSLVLLPQGSDEPLAVRAIGQAPTLAWVPVESLEPNTTYEAHYNPGYEGIPDDIWEFTTGTESTPPLAIEGKLAVSFEAGTETIRTCTSGCGNDCVETGTVAVTKARVKLPRRVGGFARRFGELWLTDERPYDFSTPSKTAPEPYTGHEVSVAASAVLEQDAALDMWVTMPEGTTPYTPCFAFRAVDARGDTALAEPLCLQDTFPPPKAAPDREADTDAAPKEAISSSNEVDHTSAGCSIGGQGSQPSGGFAIVGLALGLIRRRRSESAP